MAAGLIAAQEHRHVVAERGLESLLDAGGKLGLAFAPGAEHDVAARAEALDVLEAHVGEGSAQRRTGDAPATDVDRAKECRPGRHGPLFYNDRR
jgi:hypothetical protein